MRIFVGNLSFNTSDSRALTVNEAKPREDRGSRGGGSNRW
jgi:hypothetical protein